ncbi:MAG: hypothetical protein Q8880_11295, partial [Bacteroidota bacterium]|nr:hypothetical protein [Bacteroidota bacterium]
MNKSLSITAIALLLYAMLISSCMKDNFDFNKIASGQWNPSIAVAAIHSNMTLNDALIKYDKKNTDHLISKDKNDFLTLIYQKTVFSQYAWEFIKLSDQIFNTTLTFPGGQGSIPPEGIEIPITPYQFNFNTSDGKSLDRIVVKSGKFKVLLTTTSSTFNLIGNLKVSIPNAQKNGVALSTEIPIINNGDKTYSIETDLSGYTINNPLTVNLTLKVKPGTTLDAMNTLNVNGNFTNIQYSLLIGKLGNYNFNNAKLDNNVDINIFKNPQNDNFNLQFSLRKPVVGLLVNNSYGIPIDLYFTKLLA